MEKNEELNKTTKKKKEKKHHSKGFWITINILMVVAMVVGTLLLAVGGYVVFILASYYRIGDVTLEVNNRTKNEKVSLDEELTAVTYNIGFGAYSQDYTFFLDTGYDDDGNPTCGYYSKGKSKEEVLFNVNGSISTVKELNPDFVMFQEVDTEATRSYKINEHEMIENAFKDYDDTFCLNFHSAYLPYPLYDMHGKVNAGLTTLSNYKIVSAERKQYTISDSLSKLFDLDRCFSVNELEVENGKHLYIVNSHMSAYDEGGLIRAKQMEELNAFLLEKRNNGDYVVIGGDFNHDLLTFNPDYNYNDTTHRAFNMSKRTPDWVSFMFDENGKSPIIDGYKIIASDDGIPSCRNNDIEWEIGKTFVCEVDGFIVSENIEVNVIENIMTKNGNKGLDGFAFSDHQPVKMTFKLK